MTGPDDRGLSAPNIIRQPTSTAEIGKMANHETRSFDCPLTESRCAEGECSVTYCVRRELEDIAFRRRQEEKPFILLDVGEILLREEERRGRMMFEVREIGRRPLPCSNLLEAEGVARGLAASGCTAEIVDLRTGEVVKRYKPPTT